MTASITPVLRIFDVAKAREFYLDFLGFNWDWEHRFDGFPPPGAPLYAQVSRDGVTLHLSEHFGDASPGALNRVHVADVAALHAEISAKNYRHARPGLETMPWGERNFAVTDPFHNRLVFYTPDAAAG